MENIILKILSQRSLVVKISSILCKDCDECHFIKFSACNYLVIATLPADWRSNLIG